MPAAAAPPAPNPVNATPRPLCLPNAGVLATPPNAGVLMPEVSAAPPAANPVMATPDHFSCQMQARSFNFLSAC
jgi:hypothetical protein